jgi:hypothetical protein
MTSRCPGSGSTGLLSAHVLRFAKAPTVLQQGIYKINHFSLSLLTINILLSVSTDYSIFREIFKQKNVY